MLEVDITELRKHLPSYLKRVGQGEEIQITSRGKIIGRIVPQEDPGAAARKRLEDLGGTMIVGDVISPIDDVEWTADENNL